jgi:8-amino-7-oxononanoate synthase
VDWSNWLTNELAQRQRDGLLRRRRTFRPLPNGECDVDGRRVRNFASNDYLNFAHDPRVIAAAQQALADAGVGATASALVCGRTVWHERLERTLAEFEGQPAAVLFPTGLAVNVGTVAALAGKDDAVFSDRLNHASLIDGCRLSGARVHIYRHDELDKLAEVLQRASSARRRFIVTDAVFSMDGDLAPLPELCEIAERFDAQLIVDEAHGTGVYGDRGRGACELFGVEERVAVRIGTLSKSLGTLGGFVTGSQNLVDYLWNAARTQIYSTALPPAVCAAATEAVTILGKNPSLVDELQNRGRSFRVSLEQRGVSPSGGSTHGSFSPIVPIVLGEPERTMRVAVRLEERGYLVGAIRPPTVPQGTSRLRITVTLAHSLATLEEFADVLGKELNP